MNTSAPVFTETDMKISSILTLVSSSLSVIGGFLLITSYLWIPEIRNNVRKMLVFLTLADIIQAGGYITASVKYLNHPRNLPNVNGLINGSESHNDSIAPHNTCKTQSFFTTSASIASFLWTTFLVIYFYRCVTYRRGHAISLTKQICMHVIAWGVPVAIASIALSEDVLGANSGSEFKASGIWCWLATTDRYSTLIWGLIAGKGWEIMAYATTLFLYIYMKWNRYFGEIRGEKEDTLRREDELFCFTWIILYCLRMWGTVRFIGDVIGKFSPSARVSFSKPEKYLMYIQSIGDSGQAFCNFVLFCVFDSTVRSKMCFRSQSSGLEESNQSDAQSSTGNENSEETDRLLTNTYKRKYGAEKTTKLNRL